MGAARHDASLMRAEKVALTVPPHFTERPAGNPTPAPHRRSDRGPSRNIEHSTESSSRASRTWPREEGENLVGGVEKDEDCDLVGLFAYARPDDRLALVVNRDCHEATGVVGSREAVDPGEPSHRKSLDGRGAIPAGAPAGSVSFARPSPGREHHGPPPPQRQRSPLALSLRRARTSAM